MRSNAKRKTQNAVSATAFWDAAFELKRVCFIFFKLEFELRQWRLLRLVGTTGDCCCFAVVSRVHWSSGISCLLRWSRRTSRECGIERAVLHTTSASSSRDGVRVESATSSCLFVSSPRFVLVRSGIEARDRGHQNEQAVKHPSNTSSSSLLQDPSSLFLHVWSLWFCELLLWPIHFWWCRLTLILATILLIVYPSPCACKIYVCNT